MDELKLHLSSKIMRGIVKRLISKALREKYGRSINVQLNDVEIEVIDGKAKMHLDADIDADNKEFLRIIKEIGIF